MKMTETNKKKRRMCKNVIDGRKHFIAPIPKNGENDLHSVLSFKKVVGLSFFKTKL